MKTKLIIVGGPSGTGKTTISRMVSEEFSLPLISKDRMKEIMFDVLGHDEHAAVPRYGAASMELLFSLAEDHLNAGASVIIEANFLPEFAEPRLTKMLKDRDVDVIQLHCTADPDVIVRRVLERANEGKRHPVHLDNSCPMEESIRDSLPPFVPMESIGTLIIVDTTEGSVDAAALLGPYLHTQIDEEEA